MDTPPDAASKRLALQRAWLDHKMSHSIDWNLYQSTHMLFVEDGTTLVLWRHTEHGPHVLNVAKVESASLNVRSGLMVGLSDKEGKRYTITADPKEVLPGVFLWTPAFCEVRFTPRLFAEPDGPRRLTLAVCAKMRSRCDNPVEGHRYVATMREFAAIWPNVF